MARRSALKAAVGLVLGLSLRPALAAPEPDPRVARPREGDRLVFAEGERAGQPIAPVDFMPDGARVMAFPLDPTTNVVKDGSRLNRIVLIRFAPDGLAEETRNRSVEGVVAYSAVCTHQGCDVAAWEEATQTFWCPCHDSRFDPRDGAKVVSGPAPKRLAALPLRLVDGVLTAAGGFTGPVGALTR